MTLQEIKDQTTMRDVLQSYGVHVNRSGMCSCPLHGADKHPSMKVYKDGFKCFTCGKYGDIFKFIQEYEQCSFKDAFIKLGGTYEKKSDLEHLRVRKKFEESKRRRLVEEQNEDRFKSELLSTMKCLEVISTHSAPFSELWCWSKNKLEVLQGAWTEKYIDRREVNETDVHRICQQVRRRINSGRRTVL